MDIKPQPIKIIALLPFKNEEWVLAEYIHSVKKITQHIIAYDDGSTDASAQMLKDAGAIVIPKNPELKNVFPEYEMRQLLLAEGRKHGGTHFICIDADEVFSDAFYPHAERLITSLAPGQSLWMDWVTLYRNEHTERIDGLYKKISKNFIFCDNQDLEFTYAFVGVSRTPGDVLNRVVIERPEGSLIHFQYLNTERSTMKRAWYMCYEHIQKRRTPVRINTTYDIQKDKPGTKIRKISPETAFTIVDRSITTYTQEKDWRFVAITGWFDQHGVEFFEPLDIWEISSFKKLFIERKHRSPKPVTLPYPLMKLNELKNQIKIFISYIKT